MRIASKTDKGLVRETNQDAYAVGELPDGAAWAVVCDGMGGYNGGNVASTLAVNVISEQLTAEFREGKGEIRDILMKAIQNANLNIFDQAGSDPALRGMGTTVVAAVAEGDTIHLAHVGDSRAYLISGSETTQLTRDHSIVQRMVENGEITPEEARDHPKKHIITRALGVQEEILVDYYRVDFHSGDLLLICTDGLSNYIDGGGFAGILEGSEFYQYPDRLTGFAKECGGADNITVVIMER